MLPRTEDGSTDTNFIYIRDTRVGGTGEGSLTSSSSLDSEEELDEEDEEADVTCSISILLSSVGGTAMGIGIAISGGGSLSYESKTLLL